MSRDSWRLTAVLVLGVVVLVAALRTGADTLVSRADFAFCNQTEIGTLDPAIATGSNEGRILRGIYEGLTRPHPATLEPLPGVAERWETSADGLEWRFHLRPDARWTDGEPVTAHDFSWSMRRLLHPLTAAAYANLLWMVVGAEAYTNAETAGPLAWDDGPAQDGVGIEAVSDHELVLRLVRPAPYLAELFSFYSFLPVNRRCLEQHGPDWIKPDNVVTNGPFRIVERRLRDRIRLARSDTYWGRDEVSLRTIDAFAADGTTTQLNMYLTGVVDWMVKPPPGLYDELLSRPDALVGSQIGVTFYRFNTERPPFDDPRVRAALTYAIDREGLARDVMRGGERPAQSFVPDGLRGYVPAHLPPRDTDRARALLAEAGYPGGEGFPIFELLTTNNDVTRDFSEATAEMWRRELGLRPVLVNQTFKVYLDSTKQGLYDIAWGAWIGDYLDPSTFLDCFLSTSGNNRTGWGSREYDRLCNLAAGDADVARRAATYRLAEEILLAELPIAPVYQRINFNMVAPRVRGFSNNLLDQHPLRDVTVVGPPVNLVEYPAPGP